MDVLDLMKLIYYIDRTALLKRRWPLTGDSYVAMKRGMILSHTYDLAKGDFELPTYWGKFIVRSEGYEVVLEGDPGDDELSESELLFINKMLDSVKDFSRSKMIERIHHKLPEWTNPNFVSDSSL